MSGEGGKDRSQGLPGDGSQGGVDQVGGGGSGSGGKARGKSAPQSGFHDQDGDGPHGDGDAVPGDDTL